MELAHSEENALEQKYKDLSGLLSNIVDSVPMFFFVKDTGDDFRYVYSSPMMNQIYGRFHNDVVGKTDFDFGIGIEEQFPQFKNITRLLKD